MVDLLLSKALIHYLKLREIDTAQELYEAGDKVCIYDMLNRRVFLLGEQSSEADCSKDNVCGVLIKDETN